MLAPAGDTAIVEMGARGDGNVEALSGLGHVELGYASGSLFISRTIGGAVTVVSAPYLEGFGLDLGRRGGAAGRRRVAVTGPFATP